MCLRRDRCEIDVCVVRIQEHKETAEDPQVGRDALKYTHPPTDPGTTSFSEKKLMSHLANNSILLLTSSLRENTFGRPVNSGQRHLKY